MIGAVDIGGTKTLVAVFDAHGKVVEQQKFSTPKEYQEFITELRQVVAKLTTKDFLKVVVGMPGRVDRDRGVGIRLGNLPWQNFPLQADAEEIFSAPALIENDAKLGALAEATILKGKYKKVLYVTISTGVGLGLVVDGKIDVNIGDGGGRTMMFEHQGRFMAWEDFASGKAIVARYNKLASEIEDPEIWKILARDFAVGILDLTATLSPDVIVIGGGVGSSFKKFGGFLKERLKEYETPLMPIPPIIEAQHPEEAVIYGCYEYAKQRHEKPAHT